MDNNTAKTAYSHLISDERWGETCLVGDVPAFLDAMQDCMFPASVVWQRLAELQDLAAERDEICEETEVSLVDSWRNELRNALQDVEPVTLPDGRQGWETSRGEVYVDKTNGIADYAGEWDALRETTMSAILPPIMGDIIIHNDRGNGCGGAGYEDSIDVYAEIEREEREDEDLVGVTASEDPEAWELARDAFRLLGINPDTIRAVYVGERADGDSGHQMIYVI